MDRAGRTKKPIDYSQFETDDEDFTFATAPPNKKSRTKDAQTKKEKREKPPKNLQKAAINERRTLDDKLYQRDLEVALALSVQETSIEVHSSPSIETCTDTETDDVHCLPLLSNCSVDSDLLELDKITDFRDNDLGTRCRRRAASKALADQRKMLTDVSDEEENAEDYKPDVASDVDSGSDSDFTEGEEAEFAKNKSKKIKETKKKETRQNVISEKKSPKSRLTTTAVTPSSIQTITIKSQQALKTSVPPKPVGSPLQTNSSLIGTQKPSWTPPSQSGNSSNPLGGVSVKSPNQGLRLGLSRFARVKPLHPSVANS